MHDCVVIGGGPAGGSAAYHLARRGYDVVVLEKEHLPRAKPCRGCVSPRFTPWFDLDFTPVVTRHIHQVCLSWSLRDPLEVSLPQPLWMVLRPHFDQLLLEAAVARGATLHQGAEVTALLPVGQGWRITTSGQVFTARYLVLADGNLGRASAMAGFTHRVHQVGAGLEAQVTNDVPPREIAYLDLGWVRNGLAWSFPRANGYSVGVSVVRQTGRAELALQLRRFLRANGHIAKDCPVTAHPTFAWRERQALHTPDLRALRVGDAAALFDPLAGAGIGHALFSGLEAAKAIHLSLSGQAQAIPAYSALIN